MVIAIPGPLELMLISQQGTPAQHHPWGHTSPKSTTAFRNHSEGTAWARWKHPMCQLKDLVIPFCFEKKTYILTFWRPAKLGKDLQTWWYKFAYSFCTPFQTCRFYTFQTPRIKMTAEITRPLFYLWTCVPGYSGSSHRNLKREQFGKKGGGREAKIVQEWAEGRRTRYKQEVGSLQHWSILFKGKLQFM